MARYDYIIIGAGSAGCVLAHRLTEDAHTTVLLLEAGEEDDAAEIHDPGSFGTLFRSRYDWAYMTEEEPNLDGRRIYWPRGKVLGGSSSINAMNYIRGNARDYDEWAEAGNRGWSFQEVLPYFKMAEQQERGADAYHGVEGPLHVTDRTCIHLLSSTFLRAGKELGFRYNDDFNGAAQEGVGIYQVNQFQDKRHSAADAYLHPIAHRPNLTIATAALATRILFTGTRASGVAYERAGAIEQADACQEVLLCGGAVNSPQLLLCSGVGPATLLQQWGIPVIAHNPGVGRNLQDHATVLIAYAMNREVASRMGQAYEQASEKAHVGEVGAFFRTNPSYRVPNLQVHFAPCYFLNYHFTQINEPGCTFAFSLLHPYSSGSITLRSADPHELPAIHANYLADERDLSALLEGIHLARAFVKTDTFAPWQGRETHPGPQAQDEQALIAYVRATLKTLYHPVGTCKMGQDALAVVDDDLHVYGVEGLRVIDASIMPTIVSGNTHAPTVMIAEKGAALIRAYAKR